MGVSRPPARVWIVRHEESPRSNILGVFASEDEAARFADEVEDRFEDGVVYSSFAVGFRYDHGTGHASFTS
jgi:hypothetical protein